MGRQERMEGETEGEGKMRRKKEGRERRNLLCVFVNSTLKGVKEIMKAEIIWQIVRN